MVADDNTLLRHEERCLEFTNTVHWHAGPAPLEKLHSYSDLLIWAEQRSIVPEPVAAALAQTAQAAPAQAAAMFGRALALREAIYRVFTDQLAGQEPADSDLMTINSELAGPLAVGQVRRSGAGFVWDWPAGEDDLATLLWPLARSAADLLTSSELLARVGQCADDRGCGWLFLDWSKNHSRRWCDINDCGNRAKQRRHNARKREPRSLT